MSQEKKTYTNEDLSAYDWIKLQKEMDAVSMGETRMEKLIRKVSENPFVPIGALATIAALCFGLYSFKTGQRKMSQYMMRTRIAAQGFTVLALVVGIGIGASKSAEKDKPKIDMNQL